MLLILITLLQTAEAEMLALRQKFSFDFQLEIKFDELIMMRQSYLNPIL